MERTKKVQSIRLKDYDNASEPLFTTEYIIDLRQLITKSTRFRHKKKCVWVADLLKQERSADIE